MAPSDNTTVTDRDNQPDASDAKAEQARVQAIAMQQARNIESKKRTQNKVLDTIIAAFDLPYDESADAAHPTVADANAFRDCLSLFRPSDLDELVSERNIDSRCGYALCKNLKKPEPTKAWDSDRGTMVDQGKWCSKECRDRNWFVRRQLTAEPAWLRPAPSIYIRLLTDTSVQTATANLENAALQKEAARQELLAMERGDATPNSRDDIAIIERQTTANPEPPKYTSTITVGDILEGLPIRTIGGENRTRPR